MLWFSDQLESVMYDSSLFLALVFRSACSFVEAWNYKFNLIIPKRAQNSFTIKNEAK